MKLYLKKQIYAHGNNFEVLKEDNSIAYTAKGDVFSSAVRLTLFDARGKEVVHLHEEKTKSKPTFEININGSIFATLHKEETWKNKAYIVDSKQGSFMVSQDFAGTDFIITFNGSHFGTIKKDMVSWRNAHILDIKTTENVEFFVAMLLGIANIDDHESTLGG